VEIERFMKSRYEQIGINNFIIQSIDSTMCGWFVLAIALWVKDNQHPKGTLFGCTNEFINLFSEDESQNDTILQKTINDMSRARGDAFFRKSISLLTYN
jgi:hypothetical protein